MKVKLHSLATHSLAVDGEEARISAYSDVRDMEKKTRVWLLEDGDSENCSRL